MFFEDSSYTVKRMVIAVKNKYINMDALFLIKSISLFAIIAFAIALLDYIEPTSEALSVFMDTHIRSYGIGGMIAFMFLSSVLSSFFVPRQLLSFVGGYAYGVLLGAFIVTLGAGLGCFLTFLYSRFMLQKLVQKKFAFRIAWLEYLFSKNPFGMALSIRILPVGSNVLLNMIAGVTKIPIGPFCLGSLIGYIPQNFVSALLGTGIRAEPFLRTSIAVALYVLAIVIGLWLFRKYRPDNNSDLKSIIRAILKPNPDEYDASKK